MNCKFLKTLFLFILFATVLFSCSGEIHREGKLLHYTVSDNRLFIVYQNKEQNRIFVSKLSPISVKWEKNISGHPVEPALFVINDFVLCNCKKGKVCLLNSSNGNTVVSVDSPLVITKNSKGFAVHDGVFYTLCNSGSVCAINIEKNEIKWEFKLKGNETISTQFNVESGILFYGNSSNEIVAVDTETGLEKYELNDLTDLAGIYLFPETLVADYGIVDGFDISTGENKWVTSHHGKVRCIMDGLIISQSDDFFFALFAENGMEIWNYPRTGTTFLSCQESLSLAAFTVKNLDNKGLMTTDSSEYFDKVYIFDASNGEKIFEYKSVDDLRVLNMTGFMTDRFYIALEKKMDLYDQITVHKFSTGTWEKEVDYVFGTDKNKEEVYVNHMHSGSNYTVFRVTTITGNMEETNYLFETSSAKLLGRMESYPEIVNGTNAYDIISYDDYFNIVEKTLPDFLIND